MGILEGATLTYFGFVGYESTTTMTKEALKPNRDVPRSVVITVVLITIIYLITGIATTGIGIGPASRYHDSDTALAISFEILGLKWMG